MVNRELLEQRIREKGLKKYFLAEKLGISNAGFHNYLNNKTDLKASQIGQLCDLLDIKDFATTKAIFFTPSGCLKEPNGETE